MLQEKISKDLVSALKEKNVVKLNVLRVLKAEIQRNEQTANGKVAIVDADVIKLVKKMIEGIKETTKNVEELSYLEAYMPSQMDEAKITQIVSELKAEGKAGNMGEVMKYFKSNFDGQYDGKLLSNIVKGVLA